MKLQSNLKNCMIGIQLGWKMWYLDFFERGHQAFTTSITVLVISTLCSVVLGSVFSRRDFPHWGVMVYRYKPDKSIEREIPSHWLEAVCSPHLSQEGEWSDCLTSRVSKECSHGQIGCGRWAVTFPAWVMPSVDHASAGWWQGSSGASKGCAERKDKLEHYVGVPNSAVCSASRGSSIWYEPPPWGEGFPGLAEASPAQQRTSVVLFCYIQCAYMNFKTAPHSHREWASLPTLRPSPQGCDVTMIPLSDPLKHTRGLGSLQGRRMFLKWVLEKQS